MGRLEDTYILAVDQGTSGTMASLYDRQGRVVASVDRSVDIFFPKPGWVEQDPDELLGSIRSAVWQLIEENNLKPGQIDCMGLANQGEALVLWDLKTTRPVYNVIGWQCVRSQDLCEEMKRAGREPEFRQRTGLPIHPEWPATKIPWALKNLPQARELARQGRLAYSQLDAWFLHILTRDGFVTDHSTASRSGFYNLYDKDWDLELIQWFEAEQLAFPRLVDSSGDFGVADFGNGWKIPVKGGVLDQAAALLGQACFNPGDIKVTYGTCTGFWVNLGSKPVHTERLSTSIAWSVGGAPVYAVAGEGHSAAAAIDWLLEMLRTGWSYAELADKAASVAEDDALVFVTALAGLGAPDWAPETRGTIYGLTAATGPEQLIRAGLEAVAFSVRDLSSVLEEEGIALPDRIVADGGMTANRYLMQFQADILGKPILVPADKEGTSLGAAFLAGLASGYYPDLEFIRQIWGQGQRYEPEMSQSKADIRYRHWRRLVEHAIDAYAPDDPHKTA